jgi:alpha/beta superfamily hydrolase
MTESAVEIIVAPGLVLEGMVSRPNLEGKVAGAVICHPHPLYGGSMDNNVVITLVRALSDLKMATLRFNFRGVGRSGGVHDGGRGELEDVRAAVARLGSEHDIEPSVLAGYSFGARIAMAAARQLSSIQTLIVVAPPLSTPMAAPQMAGWGGRVAAVAGSRDPYCSIKDLEQYRAALGSHLSIRIIDGADHFFAGFERELAGAVTDLIQAG